jgi:hypothetical protein
MSKHTYFGILPWPTALAIWWTFLWRSTLLTFGAATLIRIFVDLIYAHPLGDNANQLILLLVSLPTWLLSLKWAIEKNWPSISAVEEAEKKLRQRIAESQR